MLPRGPKRGGIRETVGFEERKAERWEEDWGMVRGMGRGGAAGHIGPALQRYIFVGQGPCALPDVQWAPCGA